MVSNKLKLIRVLKIMTILKYLWLEKYKKYLQKSITIHHNEGFKNLFINGFN